MRIFYAALLAAAVTAAAVDLDPAPPAAPPGTRLLLAPADRTPRILPEQEPPAASVADPLLRMRRPAGIATPSRVGAVTIGDLTFVRAPDGRTTTLTQSGNLLIRQDAAGTTFTRVKDAERPPVFLRDAKGRVSGPMSTVPGSESPRSTMPSRPKTLPPPQRTKPADNLPRPTRNTFSSMPSRPGTLPAPGRGR